MSPRACVACSPLMKSALSEVRRARPLLGTFVEITAQGPDEARLHRAIDEAFSAVCAVHRLMNFHDPASDVGRLNAEAARKRVRVHPWTRRVLLAARNFSRETGGAFDITVASRVRDRRLPAGERCAPFLWRLAGHHFRAGRPGAFSPPAADRSGRNCQRVLPLIARRKRSSARECGPASSMPAAICGCSDRKPRIVHIRHPLDPGRRGRTIRLRESSLATSVSYVPWRRFREPKTVRRWPNASACPAQLECKRLRARLHDG